MYYTVLAVPTETRAHRRLRGARARMKAGRISSNVKECKFGLFSSRHPTSNVNNKSVLRVSSILSASTNYYTLN